MSYRACFDCELIFEIDDAPGVESMVCPQCEQLLEAYQPEAEELGTEPEPEELDAEDLIAEDDGAIASTMAIDGLADAVQSRIDNVVQQPAPASAPPAASETPTGEHEAVAVAPVKRKPFPEATHRPRPRFGQSPTTGSGGRAGGGKTRVLEAVDDLAELDDAAALGIEPELAPTVPVVPEMAPTAMLDVSLPPMPRKGSGEQTVVGHQDPQLNIPTMLPPSQPPKRTGLWIVLAALVLGGGGAGAWFMLNGTPDPKPTVQTPTKPVPKTWTERIEAQLDAGEAKLPVVSGLKPAEEVGVFIAGGPEGLMTSVGPVTGLPATRVRSDILDSDVDGHWVRPLVQTLARAKTDASEPFSMALDTNMTTKNLLRIAYGAFKHGHQSFNLLVGRTDGGLGALGFKLHFNSYPDPAKALVLRIGRTRGFHVTVQAEGKVISQEPRLLPRRDADGKLDLRALGDRLDQLAAAHPGVSLVIVHPLPSMPLDKLAAVLTRIRGRGPQPRFTNLRLLVR